VYLALHAKVSPLTLIKRKQRINASFDLEPKEQVDADDESRRG
jgi:hypothetical protein